MNLSKFSTPSFVFILSKESETVIEVKISQKQFGAAGLPVGLISKKVKYPKPGIVDQLMSEGQYRQAMTAMSVLKRFNQPSQQILDQLESEIDGL